MMSLAEAATVVRGRLHGGGGATVKFTSVAIDSRETMPGDLFVAIDGRARPVRHPRSVLSGGDARDGHDFIADAAKRGAVAALVSADAIPAATPADSPLRYPRSVLSGGDARARLTGMPLSANRGRGRGGDGERGRGSEIPRIQVTDTTVALGQLGADWRRRFDLPLVAVTGSNGKTTVTALIASIFGAGDGEDCLAPRASFNNQWGVPLTLLRLRKSHTAAVIEMGMNRAGEIAALTAMARPTVALVNNVAPAHLAGFADLHGVAAAKAEIFRGLSVGDEGGVAVLNADDAFHDFFRDELRRLGVTRVVRFSAGDTVADIRAAALADGRIEVEIAGQTIVADWKLPGAHNIANAAAAAAAAHAAGAAPAHIAAGLSAFPGAFPGRLFSFTGRCGATVIDDSYNANPASMRVALEHLAAADGARIAALGAMAELGEQSAQLHRQIGDHARELGIAHVLCLDESRSADIAALLAGHGRGERFDDLGQLMARLLPLLDDRATVLIKGSRATDMGRVAEQLKPSASGDTVAAATNPPPGGSPPC